MVDRSSFDLFAFLDALNRRDMHAYERLSEEGKKAASPLVVMRWLSGTSDLAQIVRLNAVANKYIFSLGDDKALLFKLIAAACTGPKRNNWIKGPSVVKSKLSLEVIRERYSCSTREAEHHLRMFNPADVVLLAEDLGWDKDSLKKLNAEFDKDDDRSRSTSKGGGRTKV